MKTKQKDIVKQIKDLGRKFYGDEQYANEAPVNEGILEFFKLNKYVSNDELEKEYENQGLEPASLSLLVEFYKTNRKKLDEMNYVGTHWKDKDDKWCYAAFSLWLDDERFVDVRRIDRDWGDDWWIAGVRKPGTSVSEPQNSLEPLTFAFTTEQAITHLKKEGYKITREKVVIEEF